MQNELQSNELQLKEVKSELNTKNDEVNNMVKNKYKIQNDFEILKNKLKSDYDLKIKSLESQNDALLKSSSTYEINVKDLNEELVALREKYKNVNENAYINFKDDLLNASHKEKELESQIT